MNTALASTDVSATSRDPSTLRPHWIHRNRGPTMTNQGTAPGGGFRPADHPSQQLPHWDGSRWIAAPQELKLEILRIASEHFRHDISAQWTQAGLFAIIQAALLSLF